MINGDTKPRAAPEIDSDLAKDVANLYSWANVEDAPTYRDFSRQRKSRHTHHATDVDIRKSDAAQAPEASIESQAQVFESLVEPEPTPVEVSAAPLPASVVETLV